MYPCVRTPTEGSDAITSCLNEALCQTQLTVHAITSANEGHKRHGCTREIFLDSLKGRRNKHEISAWGPRAPIIS